MHSALKNRHHLKDTTSVHSIWKQKQRSNVHLTSLKCKIFFFFAAWLEVIKTNMFLFIPDGVVFITELWASAQRFTVRLIPRMFFNGHFHSEMHDIVRKGKKLHCRDLSWARNQLKVQGPWPQEYLENPALWNKTCSKMGTLGPKFRWWPQKWNCNFELWTSNDWNSVSRLAVHKLKITAFLFHIFQKKVQLHSFGVLSGSNCTPGAQGLQAKGCFSASHALSSFLIPVDHRRWISFSFLAEWRDN